MEKIKVLEISSKKEQEQVVEKKGLGTKTCLMDEFKEVGQDGKTGIRGLVKAFAKKIVAAFEQVSGEDLTFTEELIQEHLAHYGF